MWHVWWVVCDWSQFDSNSRKFTIPLITQGDVEYYYIDVWSSLYTWGGGPLPEAGDLVEVPPGQTLLLDMDTPILKVLLIKGKNKNQIWKIVLMYPRMLTWQQIAHVLQEQECHSITDQIDTLPCPSRSGQELEFLVFNQTTLKKLSNLFENAYETTISLNSRYKPR